MAGKSNYLAEANLKLIYQGIADAYFASGVGDATEIYVALHTSDPTDAGSQSANEPTSATYGANYARVAVPRSNAGWQDPTSTAGTATTKPVAPITFPSTDGSGTGCVLSYFSTGWGASGDSPILHSGPITPAITIPATTVGVLPQLTTATIIQES